MVFVPLQGLNHSASVAEGLEDNTRSALSQGLFCPLINKPKYLTAKLAKIAKRVRISGSGLGPGLKIVGPGQAR